MNGGHTSRDKAGGARIPEDSWEPRCVPALTVQVLTLLREINLCFKAAAAVCLCDSQQTGS